MTPSDSLKIGNRINDSALSFRKKNLVEEKRIWRSQVLLYYTAFITETPKWIHTNRLHKTLSRKTDISHFIFLSALIGVLYICQMIWPVSSLDTLLLHFWCIKSNMNTVSTFHLLCSFLILLTCLHIIHGFIFITKLYFFQGKNYALVWDEEKFDFLP